MRIPYELHGWRLPSRLCVVITATTRPFHFRVVMPMFAVCSCVYATWDLELGLARAALAWIVPQPRQCVPPYDVHSLADRRGRKCLLSQFHTASMLGSWPPRMPRSLRSRLMTFWNFIASCTCICPCCRVHANLACSLDGANAKAGLAP